MSTLERMMPSANMVVVVKTAGNMYAINVSGDIGIQIELKNNKKILIGTQKETEAKNVLNTYLKKH